MANPHTVSVTGIVHAPLTDTWRLFRPFGAPVTRWWKDASWVGLVAPGVDAVGAIRTFVSVSGYVYQERLVTADETAHVLQYELVSSMPPLESVRGIVTTIEMTDAGPGQTRVCWSSDVTGGDAMLEQIRAVQTKVYTAGIADLEHYFHPAVEANVAVQSGNPSPAASVDPQAMLAHLMTAVERLKEEGHRLILQLAQQEPGRYGYARYARLNRLPDVPLEELPKLAAGLPPSALLDPRILGTMFTRTFEYLAAQRGIIERMRTATDPFRIYFQDEIRVPERILAATGRDDEFCRQLFQGACPHVVSLVRDAASIPPAFRDERVDGRPLTELVAQKRLFLCDYSDLLNLGDPEAIRASGHFEYKGMVIYAPLMMVAKDGSGADQRFRIVGIQLTQRHDNSRNRLYRPGSSTPNKYHAAKLHVACADMQYQEWIYHLGLAHLINEPFAIAHHNAFPKDHPIGALLAPHFRDTIGINFLARQTLVSYTTPFTDSVFSTGSGGALKVVLSVWKRYDFQANSFPAMLAARGFDEAGSDGVSDYYYRDDGFLLWNAIEAYARQVVEEVYGTDAEVAADEVLDAWARESTGPDLAAIPGFPTAFTSRDQLVRTLTIIIHNSSVMHAAVNYTQMDYQAYLPNRSPSLVRIVPETDGDVDAAYVLATLPGQLVRHFQALFSYVLTMPGQQPLLTFPAPHRRLVEAHAAFQARLLRIGQFIAARNRAVEASGGIPYPYLHPANIPASVAI